MKLTTLGQMPDKIAQILKLEAVIAILTLLSMGLTTETADIRWMLNQTLGYMLIAIIGTAILYVIVIGLYLMLYIHKLNPVLKYQEKIEGKIKAMTDIGGTLEMFKTSNSLEKEMIKLEIESLLNLGTLAYNDIHILNKMIIDKILDEIAKVIKNVKKKLTTGTTFDEKLYCIDLKKMFDTSDDKLYNDIEYYLDKILSRKKLAAEYCGDMLYVHGWYMADYFNNEFTQNKITSLCEDIKVMYNIKDHIKAAKKDNVGNPEVYPKKDITLSKLKAYLNLNDKFYSTYSDFDGNNEYVCIFD